MASSIYKDQFYPLLSKHHYQEGSLQAISLDHVSEVLVLSHVGHSEFILLILCDKATAISVQSFILGSSSSRFVTRSHLMANDPEHASVYLAKIECFKKNNVKSSIDSSVTLWTACLSFYQGHCCKVWFGGPTQVWAETTFDHQE